MYDSAQVLPVPFESWRSMLTRTKPVLTTSLRLVAANPDEHDHDGHCSGRLRLGAGGRLIAEIVCDDCGARLGPVGAIPYHLDARPTSAQLVPQAA